MEIKIGGEKMEFLSKLRKRAVIEGVRKVDPVALAAEAEAKDKQRILLEGRLPEGPRSKYLIKETLAGRVVPVTPEEEAVVGEFLPERRIKL